ncbi:MAG TPA: type I pullulanase [Firmicutes bacterium]|nr:type I pullulanase [Bacillota bacterium]
MATEEKVSAYLDEYNKITVLVPKSYYEGNIAPFKLCNCKTDTIYEMKVEEKHDFGISFKYVLSIQGFLEVGRHYELIDCYHNRSPLLLGYIARTLEFDKRHYYNGDDLGPSYSKGKTRFKVWSPTATDVELLLITDQKSSLRKMKRCPKGVWDITIEGDLEYAKYRYRITNNLVKQESIDPYATASCENAEYSMVIDPLKCVQINHDLHPPLKQPTDAIIYEVSIRDITIDPSSGVALRGKYLGLAEMHTKTEGEYPTGLAYLKSLGVTHIQLLPIFDFEGVDELNQTAAYNWGYNPSQYNVPEGSYATDAKDPYARINELRTLINTIHEQGMGVIMDVVYNHVFDRKTHPFDAIVPTYYYRYDYQGMASNGTGCGNDLATERLMVRKYILDSVRLWVEEYGVDGFRFDLMGILDVDTMNEVRMLCDELNPSLLVYGEGWDMATPLLQHQKAAKFNAYIMPNIAHFNDEFRDNIKGHTFNQQDRGLALGNFGYANIGKQLLAGSAGLQEGESYTFYQPAQSINYIECHDNHTLWDKMALSNGDESEGTRKKRQLLATAMVLFSQGIPLLHCGQEFFRSKNGVENSYNASDRINCINWGKVAQEAQAINLIKGYIKIRKHHKAFRFDSAYLVKKHLRIFYHHQSVIEYSLKNVKEYGDWDEIRVFFNTQNKSFEIPVMAKGFNLIAHDEASGIEPIGTVENVIPIKPLSTTIVVKKVD